jgi:DNA primase
MATTERAGIADFYEREVLPALTRRLDSAFPEFGWRRDTQGWRATNQEFTHATLGARADRVVCHGDAPRGFLVHGQGATLWTTYLNGGQPARGREFVEAVRILAERAGIEVEHLNRPPTATERKANLLHDAFELCQRELASDRGSAARTYLCHRGIPHDRLDQTGVGVMPHPTRLRLELLSAGHTETEITDAGLLADTRWPGRIVGPWRDEHSRIVTLWARTIEAAGDDRYLYLRGAPRSGTIPYGLSDVLPARAHEKHEPLLLVEGVIDVHILRANDMGPVAALGGTAVTSHLFEQLHNLGIEHVVISLDNDPAGHDATARSVDASVQATRSPDIWIVDPDLLGPAKDPGDIIRESGANAWRRTSAAPVCGVTWRALDLTDPSGGSPLAERAGLARAESWLAHLPARLAVEQTTALAAVATSLGHDPDAVRRAFRARH